MIRHLYAASDHAVAKYHPRVTSGLSSEVNELLLQADIRFQSLFHQAFAMQATTIMIQVKAYK
jgi:hypothetical protein